MAQGVVGMEETSADRWSASEGACVERRGNKSRTIIGEANLFPFTAQHEKKLHIKIIKSKTT